MSGLNMTQNTTTEQQKNNIKEQQWESSTKRERIFP